MKLRTTHTRGLAALLFGAFTAAAVPAEAQKSTTVASARPPAPPSPAAGSTTTAAVPSARADYRLEPGDKLRIEVYKDAQLSQSIEVRPDGKITMPLIGDLEALGATPLELRDRVTLALKQYVNNPVVSVVVVEATQPTAYVVGEVNHPGTIPLKGDVSALQAIAIAGGLKDFANVKNIRILRAGAAGPSTIPVNYRDALKGLVAAPLLKPGDTLVVPD